jgi:hypothetical protein
MTITKTEVLQRCETYPAMDPSAASTTNDANPSLMVVMTITFDDAEDTELPVTSSHVTYLNRYDSDGNPTDVSGQMQLVQNICAAVWTND